MIDPMLPLPGLSRVGGKSVVACFDGGLLSSDAGILDVREVEQRLGVADRLAACLEDPRDHQQTKADDVGETVDDLLRRARRVEVRVTVRSEARFFEPLSLS